MGELNDIREREFARLDAAGQVYVDHTGAGLYPESLVRVHAERLLHRVIGNPHSRSPAAMAATEELRRTRDRVRRFFRASADEYEVIFTANATAALKLVAESHPFCPACRLVLTADNHNSVLGVREFARSHGADVQYVPLDGELRAAHVEAVLDGADPRQRNLFVFPAQSNFSGVRHPLSLIGAAQDAGYAVLLDAAAYVPTSRLDLGEHRPEFVCVSFYKMFGFPTGVGALIARRDALEWLRRPWFSGGTVRYSSMQNPVHIPYRDATAFEDGTPNFLALDAVHDGLEFLDRLGMEQVGAHVEQHTARLIEGLAALRHEDGTPLVRLYGPADMRARGGAVAFNLLDARGTVIDSRIVEQRAAAAGISLRTGRFCNPGAAEFAFEYPERQAQECFDRLEGDSFTLQDFSVCMDGRAAGAVRVSLGVATNAADIARVLELLATFRVPAVAAATPQPAP